MSGWLIANGLVEIGVSRTGGRLGPVRFRHADRSVEPMHRAPWLGEPTPVDPPMLAGLQGDFFCAPFGANDLVGSETRDHGLTANGSWRMITAGSQRLELELEGSIQEGRVRKLVRLEAGHPVVYQLHRFHGGEGALPLGHHAMLRAPEGETLELSFSRWAWAGTPPGPPESDPALGHSQLRYPQRIETLNRVELAEGGAADLTRYPTLDSSEEILMLVTDPDERFGWSAAVAPTSGWIWFSIRPNSVLRSTLLWLSNGGRYYPPFLGRHRRVLGIEEVTSYFHLGHRASVSANELNRLGFPTAVTLDPAVETTTRYAFGLIPAPEGFRRVDSITVEAGRLALGDRSGATVTVPIDTDFLGEG